MADAAVVVTSSPLEGPPSSSKMNEYVYFVAGVVANVCE
jgi:hypothetical protein